MMQFFHASVKVVDFLLKNFNTHTTEGLFCVSLGIIAVAIMYEAMKSFKSYLLSEAAKSPLIYGKTVENLAERSPMMTPLLIPSSIDLVKRRKIIYHLIQTFLHMIEIIVGYILMLTAGTYNIGLFLAILFGAAVGYFIFPIHSPIPPTSTVISATTVVSTLQPESHQTDQKTEGGGESSEIMPLGSLAVGNYASIVPQNIE